MEFELQTYSNKTGPTRHADALQAPSQHRRSSGAVLYFGEIDHESGWTMAIDEHGNEGFVPSAWLEITDNAVASAADSTGNALLPRLRAAGRAITASRRLRLAPPSPTSRRGSREHVFLICIGLTRLAVIFHRARTNTKQTETCEPMFQRGPTDTDTLQAHTVTRRPQPTEQGKRKQPGPSDPR